MIQNEEIAANVNQSLQGIYRSLEDSIRLVNAHCCAAEAEDYRHRVGNIFYTLIFEFFEPLYVSHPKVKPDNWDDE